MAGCCRCLSCRVRPVANRPPEIPAKGIITSYFFNAKANKSPADYRWPFIHPLAGLASRTASSTIRQIGLPDALASFFSRAFVSGRIEITSLGYSLVFRGLPFASTSAGGRPGLRFLLIFAIQLSQSYI